MPNIEKIIIKATPQLAMGFAGLDISIQNRPSLTTVTHVLLNRMTRTTDSPTRNQTGFTVRSDWAGYGHFV